MPIYPRLILLTAALLALAPAHAQEAPRPSLSGDWSGEVATLELTFHLTDPAGGPRAATLDITEQNVKGLLVDFRAPGDSVYLHLSKPITARFAGRRSADGRQLVGEWQQGLRAFPLTLARAGASEAAGPKRPQQPHAPFPYQSADVTFRNEKAGINLAGTYTVPADMGPFAAVVLLTGSGPEDRNSTVFGHQPFAVLADYLTRQGIAVLRFDDRGVGQSGGTLQGTTSADYTTDAQAALAWLRAQPGIRKSQVGLLGHSEGGTAAIGAAGQPNGPDFLVLLASPAQALPKVHCPVLALGGSKDVQEPATRNLAATAAALKAAANRDVTVRELPGLNHLFQTASTGSIGEYATIEETFAPAALQIIGDWITHHTPR